MKLGSADEFLTICHIAADALRSPAVERILDWLGGCRVVLTDKIQTLGIMRVGKTHRLEVSPSFLAEHVESPREVLALLLHELLHRASGDLQQPVAPADRMAMNVIFDIAINGLLLDGIFGGDMPLFDRLYKGNSLVSALLKPPPRQDRRLDADPQIQAGRATRPLQRRFLELLKASCDKHRHPDEAHKSCCQPHQKLAKALGVWTAHAWRREARADALLRELRDLLPKGLDDSSVVLLGDHSGASEDGEADGPGGPGDAVLDELARRLRDGAMAGGGGPRRVVGIGREDDDEAYELLARRMRAALSMPAREQTRPGRRARRRTPLPMRMGGRELSLRKAGLWPGDFPGRRRPEPARRCLVFLDVSGSTHRELPGILDTLERLEARIHDPVYLFSTDVQPISLSRLKDGIPTRGGTDFGALAETLLGRGPVCPPKLVRALIITDGLDHLPSDLESELLRSGPEIFVLLTRNGLGRRNGLADVAKEVWELPPSQRPRPRPTLPADFPGRRPASMVSKKKPGDPFLTTPPAPWTP